jgi:hypothetical protein
MRKLALAGAFFIAALVIVSLFAGHTGNPPQPPR